MDRYSGYLYDLSEFIRKASRLEDLIINRARELVQNKNVASAIVLYENQSLYYQDFRTFSYGFDIEDGKLVLSLDYDDGGHYASTEFPIQFLDNQSVFDLYMKSIYDFIKTLPKDSNEFHELTREASERASYERLKAKFGE